jgi:hypothetical protein
MCKRVLKRNSVEEGKKKNEKKLVRWTKALWEISKDLDFKNKQNMR